MAWILPVRRRSVSCVSAAHAAELRVGLVDEDQHAVQGLQRAAEPFEDHVRLAVPLAADVLQHEHGHVEFAGHGLEDEGLAAADRTGHRRAGKGPVRPGRGTAASTRPRMNFFSRV